ncbi:MAG: branched-chain amino acid ABC transporter permease [Jatrophihabitans sp.]|uniref:branched-chain amino acid ABC transporter permease n=1 Tax=Jatrophihabitans sp. TaxID=1932789 RepID=UPI003F7E9263
MTTTSQIDGDSFDRPQTVDGELVASREEARPPRRGARARSLPFVVQRGSGVHLGLVALGLAAVVGAILYGGSIGAFEQGQLTRVMIYAVAIAGLNIATGYTGLVSVGHSAFFGLGAYTTGILVVKYGWEAEKTLPIAFAVCFVVGLVVGLPALRIRGLYLAIVTLAFGVAFPEVVARFDGLTGGASGLTIRLRDLKPPEWTGYNLGEQPRWLYWFSAAVLLVVMIVVHNVVRSRYGLAMMASRDNEIAASSCGVNLAVAKTVSFGLSGAITGVGGSLFAMYLGTLVANDSFTLLNAIALLTGLVIGGEGTRFGAIVGGLAVVYIPYYSSSLGQGESAAVIFGAALIVIVFVAPEGITGAFFRFLRRVLRVIPRTPRPYVRADRPEQPAAATAARPDTTSGGDPADAPDPI